MRPSKIHDPVGYDEALNKEMMQGCFYVFLGVVMWAIIIYYGGCAA